MEEKMEPVSRREGIALLAGFALAAAHQYLFYGNGFGVSVPIFVILFYLYIYVFAKGRLRRPITWFDWLAFAAVLLLSMTFVLFANPLFFALNLLALPCLILLHTTYLLDSERRSWSDPRLIIGALDHLIPQCLRHFGTVFALAGSLTFRKLEEGRRKMLGKVLIGLAFSMPLLMIVISLLSSADGRFDRILTAIPDWLSRHITWEDGLFRLIWIILLGILLFGYLWGFVNPWRYEPQTGANGGNGVPPGGGVDEKIDIRFDPVITATVLISVNIVYLAFVSLQFTYLFGAWRGVLPEGSTYAEYARSGFLELVAVTAINFAILIGTLVFGGEAGTLLRRLNRAMLYILVVCSCIMLVSAYTRLVLYEQAYGYTYIRFLVHAFMIFLGVLLLCAGLRIRYEAVPLGKCFIVIGLVAYVAVNYANMDRFIAAKNIEHYADEGRIDSSYLTGLSADALPMLLSFSREHAPDLNRELRERWQHLRVDDRGWPGFNAAKHRALQALKQK
ncbi:DUF4173 domain-containing protein [Paenibacillus sp. M1]|uniref:DUF4173 domain-containing protein n=1 Tax=Paenibacillus haidiansis TaxID=1574488 RepID=A0ABU7VRV7_9BACL